MVYHRFRHTVITSVLGLVVGIRLIFVGTNSSRPLDQFVAPATRKIALRHRVSVSPSERPLRLIPATAPWCSLHSHYSEQVWYCCQVTTLGRCHFQLAMDIGKAMISNANRLKVTSYMQLKIVNCLFAAWIFFGNTPYYARHLTNNTCNLLQCTGAYCAIYMKVQTRVAKKKPNQTNVLKVNLF